MSDGRHRAPLVYRSASYARRRRHRWLAVVAATLLVIGGGVGWRLYRLSPASCGGARLTVAAAAELVPAVQAIAGNCLSVRVTPVAAHERPGTDVWIPASTAWLALHKTDYTGGTSVAQSPLVLVAPRPAAEALGWPAKQPSWAMLALGQAKLSVAPALTSTEGLLTVLAVQAAMDRAQTDEGIAQLAALTVRSKLADANADTSLLLTNGTALFPALEWQYARHAESHDTQLVALYPADGTVEANYPLMVSAEAAADPARSSRVQALLDRFRAPGGQRLLVEHSLRPPGTADARGRLPRYQQSAGLLPPPVRIAALAAQWAQYKPLTFQVLLLIDASWSMNDPVTDRGGTPTTKAALLRTAGTQAARLFGDETSLAMWMFSTQQPGKPYREVIPFGPVTEKVGAATRRELVGSVAGQYQPIRDSGTPLFETVLRGAAEMRGKVRAGAVTLVVVLTDGHDEGSAFAMGKEEFLAKVSAGVDPRRPVPVFGIGYGGDADLGTLAELGRRTGGQAVGSSDPGDLASSMAQVFLAAHRKAAG